MRKNKPFKVDLGFGDLFGTKRLKNITQEQPVRIPAYSGYKYAIYTVRDGVTVKHTFKNSNKAKAFLETARGSGSYDSTSNILLDF